MSASVRVGGGRRRHRPGRGPPRSGTVQSIERAFGLLETMADDGGTMGLSQLASQSGLPLPDHPPAAAHPRRPRLPAPGAIAPVRPRPPPDPARRELRADAQRLGPAAPGRLVDELGESANLAMLDGDEIVYVAQAQSRHSMRMFTEVGRRVLPHCTAVGKAIMAQHAGGRGARPAAAHRHARAHRHTPSPTPTPSPARCSGSASTATRSTRGAGARRALRRRGRARRADQARTLGQRAGHPDDARGHRTHVPDPARGRRRPLPRPRLTGPRPPRVLRL